MDLYTALAGVAVFIVSVIAAFLGGKRDGKKASKIDSLEAENELRITYEEIDNSADVNDPFSQF